MRKVVYTPLALVLVGCQWLPFMGERDQPAKEPVRVARVMLDSGRVAELPERPVYTERDRLFSLIDEMDLAYEVLDFKPPYPMTRIVTRHKHLPRDAVAAAVVDERGREYIYLRRSYMNSNHPLRGFVRHELSHLKAWRVYGHHIPAHGWEFRYVCQRVTSRKNCDATD